MAQVTLLCGPACAGKSTLAHRLEAEGATVLSFDREAWARGVHDGAATEPLMAAIDVDLHARMRAAVAAGERVVLDASLSTRAVRDEWRMRCGAMGATHELVVVRAPLSTLCARLRDREPGPESVVLDEASLERFVAGFEWPDDDEPHRGLRTA